MLRLQVADCQLDVAPSSIHDATSCSSALFLDDFFFHNFLNL